MKRILGLLSACGSVYGDLFEPQIAAMFLQIFFEGVWMMCIVTFLAYELSSWRFVKIFAAAIVVGMLFIAAFVALKRNELWRVLSSKARHEWRMNERHAALRFDVLTRRSDGRHVSVSREWFKCTPCETLNDPISLFVKGCDMPGDEPPSCSPHPTRGRCTRACSMPPSFLFNVETSLSPRVYSTRTAIPHPVHIQ